MHFVKCAVVDMACDIKFLVFASLFGHVLFGLLSVDHVLLLSFVPLFTPLSLLPGVSRCSLASSVLFSNLVLCI